MDSTHLFLIDVAYMADLPTIEAHLAEHRAYLAKGYEAGFLLASVQNSAHWRYDYWAFYLKGRSAGFCQ